MPQAIEQCLSRFSPISLQSLNAKAEMLERIDNKYIMPANKLVRALTALSFKFDVLEIEGQRAFSYSTRYFDDVERRGYYDHHQRRRKRVKARVRHYVDADFSFLEVKLNEQRSMTAKRRLKVDRPVTALDDLCMDFVQHCYSDSYGGCFDKSLIPVILIEYRRITLVAKEGGERLTIDTGLRFSSDCCALSAPGDIFIIETKSARGNGIADKVFRALHVQPTKRVSKYCIGMAVTGQVERANGFLPAIRKLGLPIPPQPMWSGRTQSAQIIPISARSSPNETRHSTRAAGQL